ncbi:MULTISPECIES: S1C family serine protease [Bacillus cereus group]|uniref:Serine endoprotease DegS n=1 Tax=Bacillus cereus TaxID=1396 RepID=A0A2C3E104_BACCE|nr:MULTISPECIES: S1C family serine protease [Bacillus cereus group]EEL48234.1 2-alkenal reductase [Bacillus cereus Rock3-44]PFK46305.1 2-alkenal reductase [Bacillus cereus]PFN05892.1 2-alkenal reductase [Bacillus cereus]PFO82661.1 2-alkenal reductase [Bacillus cereus]PFS00193.1 2-alkenal reductase [Bacillus cereus]
MSFIDEEEFRMKRTGKKKHKGIVISSIAGTIVGASLFAFGAPLFSGSETRSLPKVEASEENMVVKQSQTANHSGFVDAVDRASEAVVGVINIQRDNFSEADSEAGTGSGVIYKRTNGHAYIVTNHHVVAGANRIEVSLSDGKKVPGKVLGSDIVTDLAVLEIDAKHVKKVIEIGDSNTVRRGEAVIAIGNPLGLQFSGTVTQGIISANERIVPVDLDQDGHYDWQVEVLQTDAAINPGNSGGALVNVAGQLIGINSMKIAAKEVEGIGLAIPVTRAVPVMDELEKHGKVRRPYVGIELRSLNEIPNYYWSETLHLPSSVTDGVCILDVKSPSPGANAGLREHDVIVAVDGKPIRDIIGFRTSLYSKKIDDKMTLTFYRGTKRATTTVKLGSQNY